MYSLKKKSILILLLCSVICSVGLTGCNKKSNNSSADKDSSVTVANPSDNSSDVQAKDPETVDPSITEITNEPDGNNMPNVSVVPLSAEEVVSDGIIYTNNKFGFSFKMPLEWKDKYVIEDMNYGVCVYFKCHYIQENPDDDTSFIENNESSNMVSVFVIGKEALMDKDVLERTSAISGINRAMTLHGNNFIVGHAAGRLPQNHPDVPELQKFETNLVNVLKTIKETQQTYLK